MTANRDPDRLIHRFLLEGEEELHYQVYDAVRAEIERTRQRAMFGPWRTPDMNRLLAIGLGAVAVVVVLFLGIRYLGSPGSSTNVGSGGGPTSTPEASVAEPSAEPSSTPQAEFVLSDGEAGGPQLTVTLPGPSWTSAGTFGTLAKNGNADPPRGAGMIGPFYGELYVYADPCHWSSTLPETPATTIDEAVAALTAQASRDASEPVEITADGYSGQSITLHVPDDAVFSECDDGKFASWAGGGEPASDGPSRHHQGPGQIDEVWILDVDGELVVVDAMYGPETPAGYLSELHAILESMDFE